MPERRFLILDGEKKREAEVGDYPFGLERHYVESLTASSTSSKTSYITALTLTTASLAGGNYKIDWSFLFTTGNTSTSFDGRVTVDGVARWNTIEDSDDDDNRMPAAGFMVLALSAGVHSIKIEFRTDSSQDVTIYDRRLALERWN